MDDKNLKNQNNINTLEDYEIEIVKKISFWTKLLYNIKNKKEQKLLPSGDSKAKKTYKSIFYMWNFGSFRTNLFNTLESFRNSITTPDKNSHTNTLYTEIIGNNSDFEQITTQLEKTIIIPKSIKKEHLT